MSTNLTLAIADYAAIVVRNDAIDAVLEALDNEAPAGANFVEIAYEIDEHFANTSGESPDDFDAVIKACADGRVAAVLNALSRV